jgi:hydrogenase nickel insertion protein HypA
MHEYSVVEQLVEQIVKQLQAQGVEKVKEIRLRRDSTFSRDALLQAYEVLTKDTLLRDSQLVVEDFEVEKTCETCGHTQIITDEDLLGHIYVCPKCGASYEIEEAHGLHILGITAEE